MMTAYITPSHNFSSRLKKLWTEFEINIWFPEIAAFHVTVGKSAGNNFCGKNFGVTRKKTPTSGDDKWIKYEGSFSRILELSKVACKYITNAFLKSW